MEQVTWRKFAGAKLSGNKIKSFKVGLTYTMPGYKAGQRASALNQGLESLEETQLKNKKVKRPGDDDAHHDSHN